MKIQTIAPAKTTQFGVPYTTSLTLDKLLLTTPTSSLTSSLYTCAILDKPLCSSSALSAWHDLPPFLPRLSSSHGERPAQGHQVPATISASISSKATSTAWDHFVSTLSSPVLAWELGLQLTPLLSPACLLFWWEGCLHGPMINCLHPHWRRVCPWAMSHQTSSSWLG